MVTAQFGPLSTKRRGQIATFFELAAFLLFLAQVLAPSVLAKPAYACAATLVALLFRQGMEFLRKPVGALAGVIGAGVILLHFYTML